MVDWCFVLVPKYLLGTNHTTSIRFHWLGRDVSMPVAASNCPAYAFVDRTYLLELGEEVEVFLEPQVVWSYGFEVLLYLPWFLMTVKVAVEHHFVSSGHLLSAQQGFEVKEKQLVLHRAKPTQMIASALLDCKLLLHVSWFWCFGFGKDYFRKEGDGWGTS